MVNYKGMDRNSWGGEDGRLLAAGINGGGVGGGGVQGDGRRWERNTKKVGIDAIG